MSNRNLQGTRLLYDVSYKKSPEGQAALQNIKKEILNKSAALSGFAVGAVKSFFVDPLKILFLDSLIALSVADHLVDSDRIYDPEFQAELSEQGQLFLKPYNDFMDKHKDSIYKVIAIDLLDLSHNSVSKQWDTFQTLYKQERGFEAGFGLGSYAGDVAGYACNVKDMAQTALKMSLGGIRMATPVVAKSFTTTITTLKEAATPVNKFLSRHTFQTPATLNFDACRLNSGSPVLVFTKKAIPQVNKAPSRIAMNGGSRLPLINSPVNSVVKPPKTKGVSEAQLSHVGKFKPESLTLSEQVKIGEWEKVRNQYLKTWREVNVEKVSNESQRLLLNSAADRVVKRNMKPDDLAGIFKEARGVKIIDQSGKWVDHMDEWRQAKNAITKLLNSNKNSINGRLVELYKQGQFNSIETEL